MIQTVVPTNGIDIINPVVNPVVLPPPPPVVPPVVPTTLGMSSGGMAIKKKPRQAPPPPQHNEVNLESKLGAPSTCQCVSCISHFEKDNFKRTRISKFLMMYQSTHSFDETKFLLLK